IDGTREAALNDFERPNRRGVSGLAWRGNFPLDSWNRTRCAFSIAQFFASGLEKLIARCHFVDQAELQRFLSGIQFPFQDHFRSAFRDRKSTRLNSSHVSISYAVSVVCLPSFPTRRSSDLGLAWRGNFPLDSWNRTRCAFSIAQFFASGLEKLIARCHFVDQAELQRFLSGIQFPFQDHFRSAF